MKVEILKKEEKYVEGIITFPKEMPKEIKISWKELGIDFIPDRFSLKPIIERGKAK